MPLYERFIYLTVALVPFNGFPLGISALGELAMELSFYVSILILLTFPWSNYLHRIRYNKVMSLALIFFGWIFFTSLLNLPDIVNYEFKGRTGVERLITQLLVMTYQGLLLFVFINFFRSENRTQKTLRLFRWISYGFFISIFVGIIEVLNNLILTGYFSVFFEAIEDVIVKGTYLGRVRGVSYEASFFAMSVAFSLPFAARGVLSNSLWVRSKGYLILLITIAVILLSWSRTGFIAVVQAMILMKYSIRQVKRQWKAFLIICIGLGFVTVAVIANQLLSQSIVSGGVASVLFSLGDAEYSVSNLSRFSLQHAALLIGLDHPLLGVGIGQFAFHFIDYLPAYGWLSPEILHWTNEGEDIWPPIFNMYARIFCETGIIGLILFLTMFYKGYVNMKQDCTVDEKEKMLIKLSLIGILGCGLSMDTFRFLPLWLILGYLASCSGNKKQMNT